MIDTSSAHNRIVRAIGAEALGHGLNIGIRIFLVPLFLRAWGAQVYGEWLMLTAAAAWFSLADLGGQLYYSNRFISDWASGKVQNCQKILSTGLALFTTLAICLILFVLITILYTPVISLFSLKSVTTDSAKLVLIFISFRFLLSLPLGLLMGVYRALGAQATSVMLTNLVLLLQFILSATALWYGGSIIVLAALEVFPFLILSIFVIHDLTKRLSLHIKFFDFNSIEKRILKESFSPSLHFLGLQLAQAITIQGSILAIGRALGPIEVAIFSTMRTVVNVASKALGMVAHSACPEYTRLHSTHQFKKLSSLYIMVQQITLIIGIAWLVVIKGAGEPLYNWWLSSRLAYNSLIMYSLGCYAVLNVLWSASGNVLIAVNKHHELARFQLLFSILSLFLCYFGALKFGIIGGVVGLILGQSVPMLTTTSFLIIKQNWGLSITYFAKVTTFALIALYLSANIFMGSIVIVIMLAFLPRLFKVNAFWKPTWSQ